MFFRKLLGISALAALLAACTSLQVPKQSSHFVQQSWSEREARLKQFHRWHINGAFSIQQRGESHIASFEWQQFGIRYAINIHSSLGLYSLNLEGRPDLVVLHETNQKAVTASSASELLHQRLGWRFPVTNLTDWIRGLPAAGEYRAKYDQYGHLTQLVQQGWQVDFSNYINFGQIDLPRTLNLSGYGVKIRIVVKKWAI